MLTSAKQGVTSPNRKMQMCILIERPTYEVSTYPPSLHTPPTLLLSS